MTALMPEDEAAWVRVHVWTQDMRKTYRTTPGPAQVCACQYGTSQHCTHGSHGKCGRGTPLRSSETVICWTDGESPMDLRDRATGELAYYRHETNTSATGPRQVSLALVWLADRVCRWICPCDCHTAPQPEPEPVRPKRKRKAKPPPPPEPARPLYEDVHLPEPDALF